MKLTWWGHSTVRPEENSALSGVSATVSALSSGATNTSTSAAQAR